MARRHPETQAVLGFYSQLYGQGLGDPQLQLRADGGWNKLKSLRDSFDFFGAKNQFAKDQLGAFPMEDWYLNVLAENSPDVDISVTPFKDRQGTRSPSSPAAPGPSPRGPRTRPRPASSPRP